MRIFLCAACDQTVFFENVRCTHCGHMLAYLPDTGIVSAMESTEPASSGAAGGPVYRAVAPQAGREPYRLCANSERGACNAAVRASDPEPLCLDCRLNDTIPDLSDPERLAAWQKLERAKRRMLYTLRELRLPIESRAERPERGLAFSFLADGAGEGGKVFTGHSDGLITINIAEAHDPFREKRRVQLGEGYRTVLGHFRHEIGHYYWSRLVEGTDALPGFRALFGDEQLDYGQALDRHYAEGAPADWPERFVSAYASMHPWEDWAETWAHYLHIVDTLGTARSYGLVLRPRPVGGASEPPVSARAVELEDFDSVLAGWIPVTVALNGLNRSMGLTDPYPFVLTDEVTKKLRFVHDLIAERRE